MEVMGALVGFTLGSLIGGVALAFHSNDVLHAVPCFTAVVFLVNAAAISRLPRASHDDRTPEERKVKVPRARSAAEPRVAAHRVLRRRSSGRTRCC